MVEYTKDSTDVAWQRFRRRQWLRVFQASVDTRSELSWKLSGSRRYTMENLAELASQQRWCFIVGCNNSGTTLVSKLLEGSGETSGFYYEGQRYTRAMARAARRGYERVWSEFLPELRLTEDDSLAAGPRLLHDWQLALKSPIKDLIVEKTTCNAVRMRWLQKVFPRSVFIAMVRDGYAVTEGTYRKGEKDVARAARHWNLVNRLMVGDGAELDNFYLLKYEDLVGDQSRVVSELSELLNVSETSLAAGMQAEYGFNTLDGVGPKTIRDMNAASHERLSAEDIAVIETEAGEMLTHFGYTI